MDEKIKNDLRKSFNDAIEDCNKTINKIIKENKLNEKKNETLKQSLIELKDFLTKFIEDDNFKNKKSSQSKDSIEDLIQAVNSSIKVLKTFEIQNINNEIKKGTHQLRQTGNREILKQKDSLKPGDLTAASTTPKPGSMEAELKARLKTIRGQIAPKGDANEDDGEDDDW
jgi:hypothetical protein